MSLSSAALSAIQQAGVAVSTADTELKNAVKDYAERVNAALASNPYGLGNDAMFENWKVVARLSQTLAGIEEELQKVFHVAAELTADDRPTVMDAPAMTASREAVTKPGKKKSSPKNRAAQGKAKASAKVRRLKPALASGAQAAPSGNAAKLLQHLERILSADEFTVIHQSAISLEIGIPLGSMTAAIKKLMETGHIIAGPSGSYKLAHNASAQA